MSGDYISGFYCIRHSNYSLSLSLSLTCRGGDVAVVLVVAHHHGLLLVVVFVVLHADDLSAGGGGGHVLVEQALPGNEVGIADCIVVDFLKERGNVWKAQW